MEETLSILESVRREILRMGRGSILFAQDFTGLGPSDGIRQALCSLTEERYLTRLAQGVYCFPVLYGEYDIRTAYPTPEEIAQAVAAHSQCRIVPYGDRAAYLVGFTTLQMGRWTYLTDGAPRNIRMGEHGTITFRHTSEMRIFSFRNRTMQLLSLAIRALGKDGITPEIRSKIACALTGVPQDEYLDDLKLCPGWVMEILTDL